MGIIAHGYKMPQPPFILRLYCLLDRTKPSITRLFRYCPAVAQGYATNAMLRAATPSCADAIGLQTEELGSLESGKLADSLVLDQDPLANIRNTNTIRYVMKNGELRVIRSDRFGRSRRPRLGFGGAMKGQ